VTAGWVVLALAFVSLHPIDAMKKQDFKNNKNNKDYCKKEFERDRRMYHVAGVHTAWGRLSSHRVIIHYARQR
jgi:hypothetical protein